MSSDILQLKPYSHLVHTVLPLLHFIIFFFFNSLTT
jgi:hypothetical protein